MFFSLSMVVIKLYINNCRVFDKQLRNSRD